MGVALYPLTFKNTFVEEEGAMTFAFRTTPLSCIRWTILHLPQQQGSKTKRWKNSMDMKLVHVDGVNNNLYCVINNNLANL